MPRLNIPYRSQQAADAKLNRGLWLGDRLMVPRLGNDKAHLNPALPSDTADFAKVLSLDDVR